MSSIAINPSTATEATGSDLFTAIFLDAFAKAIDGMDDVSRMRLLEEVRERRAAIAAAWYSTDDSITDEQHDVFNDLLDDFGQAAKVIAGQGTGKRPARMGR